MLRRLGCPVLSLACACSLANADFAPFATGPAITPGSPIDWHFAYPSALNERGQVVAAAYPYVNMEGYFGAAAFRWDVSSQITALPSLGPEPDGTIEVRGYAIMPSGAVLGVASQFHNGIDLGTRAVRWDSNNNPFVYETLGSDSNGRTASGIYAANSVGRSAGVAQKYVAGASRGTRAVRWDTGGHVTELPILGSTTAGVSAADAWGINDSGVTVGRAIKYVDGVDKGYRPVRWDAAGNIFELPVYGTDARGVGVGIALRVNASGYVIGQASRFGGTPAAPYDVLWDPAGNLVNLRPLTENGDPFPRLSIRAINDAGYTVGESADRAVIWDSAGNPRELPNPLGIGAAAFDVNSIGQAIGAASFGGPAGSRAVYWDTDGSIHDLNDLIDPASGWFLREAVYMTESGWVTGEAGYDPDGPGPTGSFRRVFVLHVADLVVPEPSTIALSAVLALACAVHRPRRRA
jgi:hypothetical protein